MSKVPAFEQLPFSGHRSISVREQRGQGGHQSPKLRRSASAYNGSEQEAAPLEIGSKGSISSLVGRDTSVARRAGDAKAVSDASHFHVWHNRLWLVPPSASKKLNAAKQSSKSGSLEAVVESKRQNGVPKWKRLLQKLKGGSNNSKFKSKWKKKEETLPNESEENTLIKCASVRIRRTARKANVADTSNAKGDSVTPPSMPLQKESSPRTTIWERRNFAQINPLNLSHLHTPRLKKAFARPQR